MSGRGVIPTMVQCVFKPRKFNDHQTSLDGITKAETADSFVSEVDHVGSLLDDMKTLRRTGQLADVIITTKEEKFLAHQAILSARSPVFAAMLENCESQNQQKKIVIEDLSSEVMSHLLDYIYSSEIESMFTEKSPEIVCAAYKYDIPALKNICATNLSWNMTVDNVLKILTVANISGTDELKESSTQFALRNAAKVITSKYWITFLKEYPEQANSIVQHLVQNVIP